MIKDILIKNSSYLILTSFVGNILGFIFWIIASKYYSPNDVGIVSAILSSITLISTISLIGFPIALIYYLPRNLINVNKIISSCLTVSIAVATLISVLFILGINIWTPALSSVINNLFIIGLFILLVVINTTSAILGGAFMAGRRMSFQMFKENIFGITKIVPLIFLSGLGTIGILLSWSIGLILAITVGFILLYKLYNCFPVLTIDPIIKTMSKYATGNYIAGILNNLPKLLFPIIILSLISSEYAGYFFIAMTMSGLLYGISQSISNSLLAESFKGDMWSNVSKAVKFNLVLLIPGLLLFLLFGRFVLGLFNPSYAEHATPTLFILATASIPVSIINIYNTVRNAQSRVGSIIKLASIITTVTLILTIPLMQMFSIEGVALAYLIGNIIGALLVVLRIKSPKEFTLNLLGRKNNVINT